MLCRQSLLRTGKEVVALRCIYCGGRTRVVDKRQSGRNVRRRRECMECGKRFTTYERPADVLYVIKRSGRREEFSRQKILAGLKKAFEKRDVGEDEMERMVDAIESRVRKKGVARTTEIGRWILSMLKKRDKIAYIRFASVYKSPSDVRDLEKILKEVAK